MTTAEVNSIQCPFCEKEFTGDWRFGTLEKHLSTVAGQSRGCPSLKEKGIILSKTEARVVKNKIKTGENIHTENLSDIDPNNPAEGSEVRDNDPNVIVAPEVHDNEDSVKVLEALIYIYECLKHIF